MANRILVSSERTVNLQASRSTTIGAATMLPVRKADLSSSAAKDEHGSDVKSAQHRSPTTAVMKL